MLQVLEGVRHIHSRDVIHGDLRGVCSFESQCYSVSSYTSPKGNILVASDGTPRIADFGLSKLEGRESSKSLAKGTLRWMAKELVACIESVAQPAAPLLIEKRSKASDVWSLGMTFLVRRQAQSSCLILIDYRKRCHQGTPHWKGTLLQCILRTLGDFQHHERRLTEISRPFL